MSSRFNRARLLRASAGRLAALLFVAVSVLTMTMTVHAQRTPPASSTPAQPATSPQTREVTLASTLWSPFTSTSDKARFALDLVEEALKRVGVTAQTTIVPDGKLTDVIQSREFAGSGAIWHDSERDKYLIYSEPYLQNRLVLVARKGTDVSATSFASMAGKRIALIQGYSYGDIVKNDPGPKYVTAGSVEDGIQKLLAGEVDYTLNDELVVQYLVENYPEQVATRLAIGAHPMVVRPLHLALRRDLPGAQEIISRFNGVLNGMVADRSYHRLLHIPWIAADIDSDGKAELIPADDRVAAAAPTGGYRLFTTTVPDATEPMPAPRRFYIGGSIYEDWANVPDAYKVTPAGAPAPVGGSTASIFTVKW